MPCPLLWKAGFRISPPSDKRNVPLHLLLAHARNVSLLSCKGTARLLQQRCSGTASILAVALQKACSDTATCLQQLCNAFAAELRHLCSASATRRQEKRHRLAAKQQTDGDRPALCRQCDNNRQLPRQPIFIAVEPWRYIQSGSFEHMGYPLLLFGRNQPFALAAMIIVTLSRETSHHTKAYLGSPLQGHFVKKAGHAPGIMQQFVGTIAGAGRKVGQTTDIKRVDRMNRLRLGFFTLGKQSRRYGAQTSRRLGALAGTRKAILVPLRHVLQ